MGAVLVLTGCGRSFLNSKNGAKHIGIVFYFLHLFNNGFQFLMTHRDAFIKEIKENGRILKLL